MAERKTGTVKWLNGTKGYGFITQDGGEDVFFHHSDVRGGDGLAEGQKVEFEIISTQKGPKAIKVRPEGQAVGERWFPFSSRKSVKNHFRGRTSDPGILPDELRERAKPAYWGLSDDPDGHSRIDRLGHSGFMSESRLRHEIARIAKGGVTLKRLTFSLPKQPGEFSARSISGVGLIRHLDGIRADQCPVCHSTLEDRKVAFYFIKACPKCGFKE